MINRAKSLLFYAGVANITIGLLFGGILTVIRFIEMRKQIKLLQKRLELNQSNLEALYEMSKIGRGFGKT